jgi:hypothetical protein
MYVTDYNNDEQTQEKLGNKTKSLVRILPTNQFCPALPPGADEAQA